MTSVDAYWEEMVTVALLGTDRRDPPTPPAGGLADLAADRPLPTPSQRLMQQVAATTVVRRAGLLPAPAVPFLATPDDDPRPVTSVEVGETWQRIVADWPVLEDEWVLAVVRSGRRLSPELVPPLLARHRTDAVRHARVLVAAGSLGRWMIGWSPRLGCAARARPAPELVAELPELPITPDIAPLRAAPPDRIATVLADGLAAGTFAGPHRAVLVNLVARLDPAALVPVAEAVGRVAPSSASIGLAVALTDLAHLRHRMLTELEPA